MKLFIRYKLEILATLGIILFYFLVRLPNLTIIPVFADEAIYIRWAQIMRDEPTLRFLPLSDGKQPLFMWAVIPFLKAFSDPLVAGRLVSVLTGFGTLIGTEVLSWYLFRSTKAALATGLFYALSPFAIFFDRMALADSMLAMFGVWTLIFGVITARLIRLDTAMLAGFSLGGALLTKSPALFYSLLLPLAILLLRFQGGWKKIFPKILRVGGLLVVTYLIGYTMYGILRLGPNFDLIEKRNQDYILPLSHIWTNPKDPFIFYLDRAFEWLLMMGPHTLIVLAFFATVLAIPRYWKEITLILTWILIPIAVQSEFAKVFTARYIYFSFPFVPILAGAIFLQKGKLFNYFLSGGIILFIAHALVLDGLLLFNPQKAPLPQSERTGYLEEWTAGTGIREVADFLKEEHEKNPNQKIVVGTEGYFGTLPDGLQMYLNHVPKIDVIGIGLGINYVHPSLKKAKLAGDKTYLVVNMSRFEGDPRVLGIRLIEAYPKAKRTEVHNITKHGPQDYLLLFEVTESAVFTQTQ